MNKIKQPSDTTYAHAIPVGPLGIVAMPGCEEMAKRVDDYITMWRSDRVNDIDGYHKDSYLVDVSLPRFGSGEAKGVLNQSVRGEDLYILVDVTNYSLTYDMYGIKSPMSPDDHYANLKRIIAAAGGRAKRVTVIMPFLYESRQHKRMKRESLDCAMALQELVAMGVSNIITFDAHDPRVQNAIPCSGFENVSPTYQFVKAVLRAVPDLTLDADHMMIISPDEGAISRAIYFANNLGLDVGMFYKRRDYSKVVDGKNPIVAHEFLGSDVEGKDVIVVDDMIASGESVIDVAKQLKSRHANRIMVCATFGLFTKGMSVFDKAVEDGLIYRIFTTNSIYQNPDTLSRPYYTSVDLNKYIALLVDRMNHDASIEPLLQYHKKIGGKVKEYQEKQAAEKKGEAGQLYFDGTQPELVIHEGSED